MSNKKISEYKDMDIINHDVFLNILEDIEDDKKEMERQRAAILNILEDVKESQEEVKKKNLSLKERQRELEAVAGLSKVLSLKIDLKNSIEEVKKHLNKIIDFDAAIFYVYNNVNKETDLYDIFIEKKICRDVLDEAQEKIISFVTEKDDKINKEVLSEEMHAVMNIRHNLIIKNCVKIFNIMVLPLEIGGENFGAISIINEKGKAKSTDDKIIKTIISTASVSIAGIQAYDRSQQSKTESLVYSLSNGVIMLDNNRKVVLVNPAARIYAKILNNADDFNNFLDKIKESGINLREEIDKALVKGENGHINEVEFAEKYFELFINPVSDFYKERIGVAVIFHDITHIRLIDKMKTEFVSVASHQLRTPLTAIKLFTEMLVRGDVGKLNKNQKEYLSNVYQSTERMVGLVNDLLNVTRIESGRLSISPEKIEINDFVKDIIAEAKPMAESKKIKIDFEKHKNSLTINIDKNLVRQVFHNLIMNAIRYSSKKGDVVKVEVEEENVENILIKVSDKGIGIPSNVQGRIFEKFYRADNAVKAATEGTGLGLYVSKMIVEQSGGEIWFKSEGGKGTTFYVRLAKKGVKEKKGERGLAIS